MKQVLDTGRRAFIHDYDGVHYDYALIPDIYRFLGQSKAEAVSIYFPDLPQDDIISRGKESYLTHQDGLKVFVDMAVEAGLNGATFREELHILYHQICYRRVMEEYAAIFNPCDETNQAFESLRGHVRHGVLTLSCVENWAKPLLKIQNRLQYFEEDALIGYADTGFANKANSPRPLEMALERLDAREEEAVFLEDSIPNIEMAKKRFPRILTVYVSHGKPLQKLPDCIDIQVSRPAKFLRQAGETCNISKRPAAQTMEFHI